MSHTVNVKTDGSIRGSEGTLWVQHGRRMVDAILSESGMPTSLTWAVQVRVAEHVKGKREPFQLRGMDKGTRRINVRLTPTAGNCTFDVSFTFTGDEIGWDAAAQKMEVAINRLRLPQRVARQVAREVKAEKVLAPKEVVFTEAHLRKLRDGLDALLKFGEEGKVVQQELDAKKAEREKLRELHDRHMEVVLKANADVSAEQEAFDAAQAVHVERLRTLSDVFVAENSRLAKIEDDLAIAGLEIEELECKLTATPEQAGASPEVLALLKGLSGTSAT